MSDFPGVEEARKFVEGRRMSRKEILLVRKALKMRRFIPGLPKLDKDGVKAVEEVLLAKERELEEK